VSFDRDEVALVGLLVYPFWVRPKQVIGMYEVLPVPFPSTARVKFARGLSPLCLSVAGRVSLPTKTRLFGIFVVSSGCGAGVASAGEPVWRERSGARRSPLRA